jgi:hypothetical protein
MKKTPFLITLVAVIGGLVLYSNRDWFARPPIQISHRFHAFSGRFGGQDRLAPVLFEFNRKVKLTSITVVPVAAAGSKQSGHPIWHLVSRSNSVPTKGFVYGMEVPGMQQAVRGQTPEPLVPSGTYRLLVEEGSSKAEHEFSLEGPTS